jgi:hypothetical protein
VAIGLLALGYLLIDAGDTRRSLHLLDRMGLAFPALLAYAFLLMLAHIATRGRVFSHPWLVRGMTGGVGLAALAYRMLRPRPRSPGLRVPVLVATALAAVALVVWGNPVARLLPLFPQGDINWHAGWASQLMVGQPTPTAPVTGSIPNSYPWLFHALVALTASFTPGGRAYHAFGPVQFLQTTGVVLGLFALGGLVAKRWTAGAWVAIFGALMGGFGFLLVRHLDVILNPRTTEALKYGGDLFFVRSYNPSFFNIAPPFPRDVAFALLPGLLVLLALGLQTQRPVLLGGAGVVVGLIGLISGESFVVALLSSGLLVLAPGPMPRRRVALSLFGPAIVVYATWFVPFMGSYIRLGGFVNTNRAAPVVLPLWDVLISWGLITPFALWGGWRVLPRAAREAPARVVLTFLIGAAGALLGTVAAAPVLGRGLSTLGRAHRYWPLLGLALAIYGGLGAEELLRRAWRLRPLVAVGLALLVPLFALPSPLIASLALARKVPGAPVLTAALQGNGSTILDAVATSGRARCVVAIDSGGFRIFAYTGYRSVKIDVGGLSNLARTHWRDLGQSIPSDLQRIDDNRVITQGDSTPEGWRQLADRYGVNLVVVRPSNLGAPPFRALGNPLATMPDGSAIFRVSRCPA